MGFKFKAICLINDPKANFIYLNAQKTQCPRAWRYYFAHAIKGTLKDSDHMFILHNLFEMNEYFILMNNKYDFFLLSDVGTLHCCCGSYSISLSLALFNTISHRLMLSIPAT